MKTNDLNILHEINKTVNIQVKTPVGVSDKKEINDVMMQGETISSIVCTSTIDKISRDCKLKSYEYKNSVKIPKQGFIDDVLNINKCGEETKKMNEYTNYLINKRKLQMSKDKCVHIHVKSKKEK